jgi:HEAT repeat protein
MSFTDRLCPAAVAVALLAAASTGTGTDIQGPIETDLCPSVENPRTVVKLDGVEVRAPSSADDHTVVVGELTSNDRDQRLRAAISLGLAGDVAAFHQILESRDLSNLSTYGRFYVNPDRIACIDREIETVALAAMSDPELRSALTAFFERNLYQRRELFNLLIGVEFEDGKPHDFNRVTMALLATRIEGVEDEVLAQAKRYLDHDTPVRKRVLPGVHRRWVEFFGERDFEASIPYMEDLLLAEGWDETIDSFISEFSQTRSRVYLTLNDFDSPEVAEVFIRQLDRVVEQCPPELVLYEISAFGPFAVRHATTRKQKRQVGELLADLFGLGFPVADPPPAATDYRTHKKIVELLSALGTTEAAAVLIADLRRLAELEDPKLADPLIVSTFEALRYLPESTEIDVQAFLAASAELSESFRLHNVPTILDARPDPAAHAFYLDQLHWIVDNQDGFKTRYHIEPARALAFVIDRLLAFEGREELMMTRNAVDELYREGTLEESRYLATSVRLNDLLGDESAVYRELQERQRIAREAEIEERREEATAEWGEVVKENTSSEGIRANVQALGQRGDRSKLAASWLVIAGADALVPTHEMLADPTTSDETRLALLQVLGEIGDPRSVRPVIRFTRSNADNRTYLGAGLRALALMPPSKETFDFARELLEAERATLMKQQALVYLALVREPLGAEIARKFSTPATEPDVRVVALFLAARLGDDEARPAIIKILETTEDRSYRDVLLRALAELSTLETLDAFGEANPNLRSPATFRKLQPLVVFRHADGDRKLEAARHLVASGFDWDRREAVRFLVEEGHTDVLYGFLQPGTFTGQPLLKTILYSPRGVQIFAQIRRMGYRIEETPDGLSLTPPRSSG